MPSVGVSTNVGQTNYMFYFPNFNDLYQAVPLAARLSAMADGALNLLFSAAGITTDVLRAVGTDVAASVVTVLDQGPMALTYTVVVPRILNLAIVDVGFVLPWYLFRHHETRSSYIISALGVIGNGATFLLGGTVIGPLITFGRVAALFHAFRAAYRYLFRNPRTADLAVQGE